MKPLHLLLPFAALLTIGSAQRDPDQPLSGIWEISHAFVALEGPGISEDQVAEVRGRFDAPETERRCVEQTRQTVGQIKAGGDCTVTRVANAGPNADYEMRCTGISGPGWSTVHTTGQRAADHYDYQVATEDYDESGALKYRFTIRETGRRVGDCQPRP